MLLRHPILRKIVTRNGVEISCMIGITTLNFQESAVIRAGIHCFSNIGSLQDDKDWVKQGIRELSI
jgi:hypothetical protein